MIKNNKLVVLAGVLTLVVGAWPVFGAACEGIERYDDVQDAATEGIVQYDVQDAGSESTEQYDDVQDAQAYYVGMSAGGRQEAMAGTEIALSGAKACAKVIATAIMASFTQLVLQDEDHGYEACFTFGWGTILAGLSAYDELVYFKKGVFGENIGGDVDINKVKKSGSIIRAFGSGLAACNLGISAWGLLRSKEINNLRGMAMRASLAWSAYLAACDSYENW